MADYDNTDSGAAFPPFDNQKLILQGNLNSNGNDYKVALVKDISKSGKQLIAVYAKIGVLFQNDTDNDKAPHYTGPLDEFDRRLAAWKGNKDGKNYLSFKVSDHQDKQKIEPTAEQEQGLKDDDIPF